MGGPVKESVLQPVNLWSCWSVNKQNTETRPIPGRLLYSKSDLPVDTSKQKTSFPMASIKHLITVQLTHSFVCLLNVFARLLFPSILPSFSPLSPPCHNFSSINTDYKQIHMDSCLVCAGVRFDWAGHAQSILEEVCEKLSGITLALTKRCECPDRGNDTGHIRLNDNQRTSSPFIATWHNMSLWASARQSEGNKRRWRRSDRALKKQREQLKSWCKTRSVKREEKVNKRESLKL